LLTNILKAALYLSWLLCIRLQKYPAAEAGGSDQLYRRSKDLLHPAVGHSKA